MVANALGMAYTEGILETALEDNNSYSAHMATQVQSHEDRNK